MATRRLQVEIIGDPSSFSRSLRTVGTEVGVLEQRFGRTGRTMQTAMGAAGTAVTRVGNAAKYASPFLIGGLALGLKASVDEAREANKVMAQTDAVIESTGGSANVSAKHLSDYSTHLSEISGLDDELIQKGGNVLLTFRDIRNEAGKGNDVFDQTLSVALDMSAALDQDLKSSIIQVGKALQDPTTGLTALRRVGVSFTEDQAALITKLYESGDAMKSQKMILAELNKEFAGSAKANADPFDRLQVTLANVEESIGKQILPGLSKVADEVSDIFSDKRLDASEKADKLLNLFEGIGDDALQALGDIAPDVAKAGANLALKGAESFVGAWWKSDIWGKLFLTGAFLRAVGGPGVFSKLGGTIARRLFGGIANTTVGGPGGKVLGSLATPGSTPARPLYVAVVNGGLPGKGGGPVPTGTPTTTERSGSRGGGRVLGSLGAAAGAAVGDLGTGVGILGAALVVDDLIIPDSIIPETIDAKDVKLKVRPDLRAMKDRNSWADSTFWDEVNRRADQSKHRVEGIGDGIADALKTARAAFATTPLANALADDGKASKREIAKIVDDLGDLPKGARDAAGDAMVKMARELESRGKLPEGSADRIRDNLVDAFGQAAVRSIDAAKRLKSGVSGNIASLQQAVDKGLHATFDETNAVLKTYGAEELQWAATRGAAGGHSANWRRDGGYLYSAGGMLPGYSMVDNVPAMLRSGEAVLTPEVHQPIVENALMATYGMGLTDLFRQTGAAYARGGTVRRLAAGGLVEQALGPFTIPPIQYDYNHAAASGNSHVHLDFFTAGQALSYGHRLQGMGWSIGEYTPTHGNPFGFGPVTTHHDAPGHYDGTAFDANKGFNETRADVAAVAALLNGKGGAAMRGAVAQSIARAILKGPDGPLKTIGQAALDRAHSAANRYLARRAPTMNTTGLDAPRGSYKGPLDRIFPHPTTLSNPGVALSQSQVASLARRAGLPASMVAVAQRESGWHPGIVGDDAKAGYGNTFGYGLWQITSGPGGMGPPNGDVIQRLGGMNQMFNPWKNAQAARMILDRQPSAWNASGGLRRGGFARRFRGGGLARRRFDKGGNTIRGRNPDGSTWTLSGTHGTSVKPPAVVGPGGRGGRGHSAGAYSIPELLSLNQIAISNAELTDSTADDITAYSQRGIILEQEHANLLNKLNKPGISQKRRSDLLDQLSSLTSEINSNTQSLDDLRNGDSDGSIASLASEIADLRAEVAKANARADTVQAVTLAQLSKFVADLVSGDVGGSVEAREFTAGTGAVARE